MPSPSHVVSATPRGGASDSRHDPRIDEAPVSAPPPPSPGRTVRSDEPHPWVTLDVAGFRSVVVSPPLAAARGPQPVLIVTHGAGGRALTHGRYWRARLGPTRGFVVGIRGYPQRPHDPGAGWYYDGHHRLAREIDAALDAIIARYGARVDAEAPSFAGYSQGASMGALALPSLRRPVRAALFWEGGNGMHQEWNLRVARKFADRGGRDVLFVCGRRACVAPAEQTARWLGRYDVRARVAADLALGHRFGVRATAAVERAIDDWLGSDPRWSPSSPGHASVLGLTRLEGGRHIAPILPGKSVDLTGASNEAPSRQ
ncbi:MAG: hypothetical protein AAF928_13520 [Myxococcota bacterium]